MASVATCVNLHAADSVSIPIQVVGPMAKPRVVEPAMQTMMVEPVEVPRSKYADVSDTELQRIANDPSIRFLLALPNQLVPVLVEAWIDGKPFRTIREERIVRLINGSDEDIMAARYRKYSDVTQRSVSQEEARWLFRRWGEDASLVTLSKNFERSRASQSPVRDVLDQNGDGVLDRNEITSAVESLLRCDANRDDIVDASEVQNAAKSLNRSHATWAPPQLIIPIEDAKLLSSELASLQAYCETNQATAAIESIKSAIKLRWEQVVAMPPKITVSIQFNSDSGQCSVTATAGVEGRGGSSYIAIGGAVIEVTAIRGQSAERLDQISLGVVNDGYPISPVLDSSEDGRLTIRELRKVVQRLNDMDRNQDAQITADELQPTIRLAIGHGLCVHDLLSTVRSVHSTTDQPLLTPPDWFVSLDKNHDGDISQREFVGTEQQFENLDNDKDGLIDVTEASVP